MDDFRHAGDVYNFLEGMLKHYTRDEDAEVMCKGLHDLAFWVSLPHEVIERAYQDRNIPDRYCTVALMAENRFLIQANEKLAAQVRFALFLRPLHLQLRPNTQPFARPTTLNQQVETLTEALKAESARA